MRKEMDGMSDRAVATLIRALSWMLDGMMGISQGNVEYVLQASQIMDNLADELDPPMEPENKVSNE